jgi:predicted alpha/beta-hydrolase family hydrolase
MGFGLSGVIAQWEAANCLDPEARGTIPKKMRVEVAPDQEVIALVYPAAKPDLADITLILGHGAGVDQTSGFMTKFATELAARGITVVTFNFLYTGHGRRVPDPNHTLEACFRAVVETTREKEIGRGTPVIGGKSMGGRIASQIGSDVVRSRLT